MRQRVEVFGRKNPSAWNMETFPDESSKARCFATESAQITTSAAECSFERTKDRFVTRSFGTNGRALIA